MPLAVIERERVSFVALGARDRESRGRIKAAAEENDAVFHRPSWPILLPGYSARTVSAIPPRAENFPVTIASRGEHAFTKSSRMRLVTASLNARSFRYEARQNLSDLLSTQRR